MYGYIHVLIYPYTYLEPNELVCTPPHESLCELPWLGEAERGPRGIGGTLGNLGKPWGALGSSRES